MMELFSGVAGIVTAVVAILISIASLIYTATRNRRKDSDKAMEILRAELQAADCREAEETDRRLRAAHARMTTMATDQEQRVMELKSDMESRHTEMMQRMGELITAQKKQNELLILVRVNLKNMMQRSNIPYQE